MVNLAATGNIRREIQNKTITRKQKQYSWEVEDMVIINLPILKRQGKWSIKANKPDKKSLWTQFIVVTLQHWTIPQFGKYLSKVWDLTTL